MHGLTKRDGTSGARRSSPDLRYGVIGIARAMHMIFTIRRHRGKGGIGNEQL